MASKIFNGIKTVAIATALLVSASATSANAAEGDAKHWNKHCVTSESLIRTCFLAETLTLVNKKEKIRIQLAAIRIKTVSNTKRVTMHVHVPNKILLQSGLRFQIDDGKIRVLPYSICNSVNCEAEVTLDTATVSQLKKGDEIKLNFLQAGGKPVAVAVPLAGFTAGYNSKGIELTAEEAGLTPIKPVDLPVPANNVKIDTKDEAKPLPE